MSESILYGSLIIILFLQVIQMFMLFSIDADTGAIMGRMSSINRRMRRVMRRV